MPHNCTHSILGAVERELTRTGDNVTAAAALGVPSRDLRTITRSSSVGRCGARGGELALDRGEAILREGTWISTDVSRQQRRSFAFKAARRRGL